MGDDAAWLLRGAATDGDRLHELVADEGPTLLSRPLQGRPGTAADPESAGTRITSAELTSIISDAWVLPYGSRDRVHEVDPPSVVGKPSPSPSGAGPLASGPASPSWR